MAKQQNETLEVIQAIADTVQDIHDQLVGGLSDIVGTINSKDQKIEKYCFQFGSIQGRLNELLIFLRDEINILSSTDNDGSVNFGFQVPDNNEEDEEDFEEEDN